MSGRIRSIKPELLEDEKTASLTDEEFRLFVAMILLADDYGNLRAHPVQLAGTIFWCARGQEHRDLRGTLESLARVGLVALYRVRGQPFAHLNGWSKHQRVDKPGKPRCPKPEDADSGDTVQQSPPARDTRETAENDSRDSRETPAPDRDLRPPTSDPDRESDARDAGESVETPDRATVALPRLDDWDCRNALMAGGVDTVLGKSDHEKWLDLLKSLPEQGITLGHFVALGECVKGGAATWWTGEWILRLMLGRPDANGDVGARALLRSLTNAWAWKSKPPTPTRLQPKPHSLRDTRTPEQRAEIAARAGKTLDFLRSHRGE